MLGIILFETTRKTLWYQFHFSFIFGSNVMGRREISPLGYNGSEFVPVMARERKCRVAKLYNAAVIAKNRQDLSVRRLNAVLKREFMSRH